MTPDAVTGALANLLPGLAERGINVHILATQGALPALVQREVPAGGVVRGARLDNEIWLVAENFTAIPCGCASRCCTRSSAISAPRR